MNWDLDGLLVWLWLLMVLMMLLFFIFIYQEYYPNEEHTIRDKTQQKHFQKQRLVIEAKDLGPGVELDDSLVAAAISIVSTQANDTPNDVTMAAITMARCGCVTASDWV